MLKVFYLAAVLSSISPEAAAQNSWGAVSGQVRDATQAGVANARIRVSSRETRDALEVATNSTGSYSIPFLAPGTYQVQVSAAGFRTLTVRNVTVEAEDAIDLPLILEIGEMSERVTVAGDPDQLQTSTASRFQKFEPEKIKSLPLIGRQAYNLISLTPGVLFTQEQFGSNGYAGLRSWDANGKYVINGGKEETNQFLLNGAPISLTGRWQLSPNVEAIQEVRVMTNIYDAQFGRTGGGTVNTTLRSGGNAWHGTGFEFLHNAVFDANSTENNREGAGRGKHITHQFGGVLGGPIRMNKDFLFLSFEGFREVSPFPVVSDTPPLDLRDGQHFSAYGIRIFDPLTTRLCRDGIDTPHGTKCFSVLIRSAFPGNVIPQSRISAVGKNMLGLYPDPTDQGLTQNYFATGNSGRYAYVQPIARWDHNFNDKDRLYALFTYQNGYAIQSTNGFPAPADIGSGTSERTGQNYIVEWTHVISPSSVADVRLSFGRFTEFFPESSCNGCLTADALGIRNFPHAPTVEQNAAPRVNLDLYSPVIGNSYTWTTQNQFDFSPSMTHLHGRHVLHFGFEFVHAALGNGGPGRANGEFSFTRQWTQQYANRSRGVLDGNGVGDLLLGLPYSGFIDYNDSFYRTWPYYAGFIQDNWKIRPNLTLTLGLRYDVQVPFLERRNRVNAGFDFSAKNPLSDDVLANWAQLKTQYDATNPKYPYPDPPNALYGGRLFAGRKHRRPYDTDWTNIQPRVGVAWTFAPKSVLRAGFGIFHRTAADMNFADGFSQRTSYLRTLDGGLTPAAGLAGPYSLENPFPNGIAAPTGSTLGLLTNVGRATSFDGRERLIPRTYQYSVAVQRELPWQMIAEVAYSGSQTVHDLLPVQLDSVSYDQFLKGQADPFYLNRQVPNPFVGILPANSDLGAGDSVTANALLRPYSLFNGITQNTGPAARYRYDALQVQLEKRVLDSATTGIVSFLFAYTFSKSFAADHRLNDWNLRERPIHELSSLDKPKNIAFAGTWDLPIGWGRRWLSDGNRLMGAFANGWTLDWIFTYYSGYPVAKPDANFLCGSYSAPGGQTASHWFNNDSRCYQSRALYTLRTTEDVFSGIRNPSAPQLNFSVEKTFWLSDRYTLQFRGESYNLTNTPILPAPNTNYRDPRFGQLPFQQSNFPRYVQIAAKLVF